MKDWRRVNLDTGMWVEDVVGADMILNKNGEPDQEYIETPVPSDAGFYWPKWDFENYVWVEGLTAEEIEALQNVPPPPPTPEERIAELESKTNEILELLNPV